MSHLKVLRDAHDLTQEQLAEKLGMDQSTYSKLERNPKTITAEQAEKLATLYGVPLADLLSGSITISFSNNTIDKGYVHNLNESDSKEASRAKDSEIASLKRQVEYLQSQNKQLLDMLAKKS